MQLSTLCYGETRVTGSVDEARPMQHTAMLQLVHLAPRVCTLVLFINICTHHQKKKHRVPGTPCHTLLPLPSMHRLHNKAQHLPVWGKITTSGKIISSKWRGIYRDGLKHQKLGNKESLHSKDAQSHHPKLLLVHINSKTQASQLEMCILTYRRALEDKSTSAGILA